LQGLKTGDNFIMYARIKQKDPVSMLPKIENSFFELTSIEMIATSFWV